MGKYSIGWLISMSISFGFLLTALAGGPVNASNDPAALQQYISGRHLLFSWRDGGAVYGTYYFSHTHHCASGEYIEYVNTHKQSVLGGENRNSWEDYGRWQVSSQNGQVGVVYTTSKGSVQFIPFQVYPDGSIYSSDSLNIVSQGRANC